MIVSEYFDHNHFDGEDLWTITQRLVGQLSLNYAGPLYVQELNFMRAGGFEAHIIAQPSDNIRLELHNVTIPSPPDAPSPPDIIDAQRWMGAARLTSYTDEGLLVSSKITDDAPLESPNAACQRKAALCLLSKFARVIISAPSIDHSSLTNSSLATPGNQKDTTVTTIASRYSLKSKDAVLSVAIVNVHLARMIGANSLQMQSLEAILQKSLTWKRSVPPSLSWLTGK